MSSLIQFLSFFGKIYRKLYYPIIPIYVKRKIINCHICIFADLRSPTITIKKSKRYSLKNINSCAFVVVLKIYFDVEIFFIFEFQTFHAKEFEFKRINTVFCYIFTFEIRICFVIVQISYVNIPVIKDGTPHYHDGEESEVIGVLLNSQNVTAVVMKYCNVA